MKARVVLALAAASLALSGGVMLACGGGDDSGFSSGGGDGGDASSQQSGGDSSVDSGKPGSGNDGGPGSDAGGGHCTPIKGDCDIVLQDCPDKGGMKQECVPGGGTQTMPSTVCVPTQASEQLPLGRACCTSGNTNPCLPGLECTGDPCTDGGPKTGRCSPHCCNGDNAACGVSDPEGISGACDIGITFDGTNASYYLCTYKEFCKPLGVQPCKTAGSVCVVTDKQGTASCQPIFNGDASAEHQPCGNGCADGLGCFIKQFSDGGVATFPDGGPQDECLWFCYTPNASTPFDAGLLNNQPGHGGCPGGETCKPVLDKNAFPVWMSLCVP